MNKRILNIFIVLSMISYNYIEITINEDYKDTKIIKVKDGELLILKRESNYYVLELTNQKANPEKAEYKWCQVDSDSTIRYNDSTLSFEKGITGDGVKEGRHTPIEFESFKFYWSFHIKGGGYVYLNYYPKFNEEQGAFYWKLISKSDMTESIFINAETDFQLIDVKKEDLIDWVWRRMKKENN